MSDFCKDRGEGVHKDPVACDRFIECSGGFAYLFHCKPGSVFNEAIGNCDDSANAPACHNGKWVTAAPATQQPWTQQPWTQQPWTQQPTTQQPWTQQPWTQPTTQQPWTQQPWTQQPWTQQPWTQQPWTQAPATQQPATNAPSAYQPGQDVSTFCKGHDDGIFQDPSDCKYFIECANGNTFREACAPGTAWNDNMKSCDFVDHVRGCH